MVFLGRLAERAYVIKTLSWRWKENIVNVTYIVRNTLKEGFSCGSVVKDLPAIAGDIRSTPGPGRSHTQ